MRLQDRLSANFHARRNRPDRNNLCRLPETPGAPTRTAKKDHLAAVISMAAQHELISINT
jgi:hypothetical protein